MLKKTFHNLTFIILSLVCSALITNPHALEAGLEFPFLDDGDFLEEYTNCLSLKHTEGKGIGYFQGYTSLNLFSAQRFGESRFFSFLQADGHAFNNGKLAANIGLGVRALGSEYISLWGLNVFYDSYIKHKHPYHQVSFGLEALGECWELYLNGYLPVGKKKTPIYSISYDFSSGFLARVREQLAMGGIDLEVGYRFLKTQCLDFYTGIGPYFYWGKTSVTKNAFKKALKHMVGGRFRARGVFLTYCELEGTATYDSRNKWGGQITVGFNLPFDWNGCTDQIEEKAAPQLIKKLFQRANRNPIIVVERVSRYSSNPEILNPEHEP